MVPQEKIRRSPGGALGRCMEQGPHSAVSLLGAVLIYGARQPRAVLSIWPRGAAMLLPTASVFVLRGSIAGLCPRIRTWALECRTWGRSAKWVA
jgi:hypothetical protein